MNREEFAAIAAKRRRMDDQCKNIGNKEDNERSVGHLNKSKEWKSLNTSQIRRESELVFIHYEHVQNESDSTTI